MDRDGSGVSALLGLDGFVVRAQLPEEMTGEWWLAVETTQERAWCPSCGVRAVGHGRRRVLWRRHGLPGCAWRGRAESEERCQTRRAPPRLVAGEGITDAIGSRTGA